MDARIERIRDGEIRDVFGELSRGEAPDSLLGAEVGRAVSLKGAMEISDRLRHAAEIIHDSTGRLCTEVDLAATRLEAVGNEANVLSKRLLWLTWGIAILTAVLVAFGLLQLFGFNVTSSQG